MAQAAVGVLHLVFVGFPYHSGALDELALNVVGGLKRSPAGLERHAAAAGCGGETHGVGVAHGGDDVFDGQAKHFGKHLGNRRARAADVHRAFYEADGSVGQHIGDSACHTGVVAAEPHSDAAPAIGSLKRRIVVRVGDYRVHYLFRADRPIHYAVRPASAGRRHVEQAKVHSGDAQRLGDFVHKAFGRETDDWRAGRAVRRGFGLVGHDVVAIYPHILYIVGREHGGARTGQGRAGIRAALKREVYLRGGDAALVGYPHLDFHIAARRGSGRLQHFGAGHCGFDGAAALARERG